ncbi:MAG: GWxTD domain-containing protein [Acidobacteriota bacterium]|nr:GWxTD domain-containing protein [Acidobacteriota bacterium]
MQKAGDLDPRHKEWLGIVDPIITRGEREVFLKLQTDAERDRFIDLFWKRRDPYPDTRDNEFRQEYMKRVRYADLNFGRGTPKKGHETERGRIYLALGPPLERQIYATHSALWPLELWHYKGEPEYGLPPYFYLIFFQRDGLGEYRLYSPEVDGPMNLVIPTMVQGPVNRMTAFRTLKEISAELSAASLSYLPGESNVGTTSLTSGSIVSGIFALAEKKYSDAYARTYLLYKDHVEVDYSHNYIESSGRVNVLLHGGQPFLHWSLEPSQINFAERDGRYYAGYQLLLKLEDRDGRTLWEREEEIPLSITPAEYEKHGRRRFAFQDVIPVIPGEFKLFLLLKNRTTRDFTSFEATLSVSKEGRETRLGRPILYPAREAVSAGMKNALRAFTISGYHYMVNARNEFLPGGEIGCLVPYAASTVSGASAPAEVRLEIRSTEGLEEKVVFRLDKAVADVLSPGGEALDFGLLPVADLKPGYYRVDVAVTDSSGRRLAAEIDVFIILSRPIAVLPWIYAAVHPPFPSPRHLRDLGSQHFLAGNYTEARRFFERALASGDDPALRLLLGKTLYALGDYRGSLALTIPVHEANGDREAAKVIALNYAALEEWTEALAYLEFILSEAQEIAVLNLAAECHLRLGRPEKALPLLRKSLSLLPSQPAIQDLEEKTRKSLDKKEENRS